MAEDEDLEYTLLNKREVMVYQIPPASSSSGHKADDWKKCIWRGRCRIAGKGSDLTIKMLDPSSGQLFAQCFIPNGEYDKYVERVIDSSRYFVLKITNGSRHAFIGLGFEDRNDAFDFNCTLSDFKSTWVDRDKQAEELPKDDSPAKDLSLKDGQKITVNLKGVAGVGGGGRKREERADNSEESGFTGLLAPPPSAGQSRRQQPAAGGQLPLLQPPPQQPPAMAPASGATAAPAAAAQEDFFGDFDDFQCGSGGAAAAAAPPQAPVGGGGAPGGYQAPGLASQLGGLSLGGSASRPPPAVAVPQQLPTQQPPPPQSFDLFAGMGSLGSPQPLAAPQAPSAAPSQQRKPGGNDPFDEFDIFK